MAQLRERPYSRFNFLVQIAGADPAGVQAGFSEVTGLGATVEAIEYRAGNARTNTPIKIPGLSKVSDVTLKRGVIGATDLFEWLRQARDGDSGVYRQVVIQLLSEDRQNVAQEWRLTNAWPTRYQGPDLSGATNDVAIEELVLACEGIETA